MQYNTVIFDMDGLLIDSEPLWNEAANDAFLPFGTTLTPPQYANSMGLRTKEFVQYWFSHFNWPGDKAAETEKKIMDRVVELVKQKGRPMPGVDYIFNFFAERHFRIGLASSSDMELIQLVVDRLGIRHYLTSISSAAFLPFGKPHPQVYLDCAEKMNADPGQCICFEDSFNGMIAAKAARMKCVIVPSSEQNLLPVWNAADLKLSSLVNFNELLLHSF
jgi:sugar-phosphatase